ncbi:MAG: cyclic nucleotide-binding domain-containing protein [Acidobacteriota bacterium]
MTSLSAVQRLEETLRSELGDVGAFLPDRVPGDHLPGPLQRYLDACRELAEHYPVGKGGVRLWLEDLFPGFSPEDGESLARLSTLESGTLLTALAALGHTYRWDTVPPCPERLAERTVALPEGIRAPWTLLAARLGQPRVGTMWTLHLCNWRLDDRRAGASYRLSELTVDRLRILHQWLDPPASSQLERFSLSFVLMEARGAEALRPLIGALGAAARRDVQEATFRLELLQGAILDMAKAFATNIRDVFVDPKTWLELVQPTFAWAADVDGTPLSGPNGLQMPSLQCLDVGLGVPGESLLAQQSLASRAYMPEPHRRFLTAMDDAGGILREFVESAGSMLLCRRYNDCVRALSKFRIGHRTRGARYLDSGRYGSSGRLSTGMGIQWRLPEGAQAGSTCPQGSSTDSGTGDPVAEFERLMNERIREMESALIPGDTRADDPTVENTFRFLTPDERARLLDDAPRRSVHKDEPIIRQGVRQSALYVIDDGFARVESSDSAGPLVLTRLWPGEVFGEMSFLSNATASASVIADEDMDVRVLDRERVYRLTAESPAFGMRFYESLAVQVASRLQDANALLQAQMTSRLRGVIDKDLNAGRPEE